MSNKRTAKHESVSPQAADEPRAAGTDAALPQVHSPEAKGFHESNPAGGQPETTVWPDAAVQVRPPGRVVRTGDGKPKYGIEGLRVRLGLSATASVSEIADSALVLIDQLEKSPPPLSKSFDFESTSTARML